MACNPYDDFVLRWIQLGLSTDPADRAAAEEGVRVAYRGAGVSGPDFIVWAGSPMAGVAAAHLWDRDLPLDAPLGFPVPVGDLDRVRGKLAPLMSRRMAGDLHDGLQGLERVRRRVYDDVIEFAGKEAGRRCLRRGLDAARKRIGERIRGVVREPVADRVRRRVIAGSVPARRLPARLRDWDRELLLWDPLRGAVLGAQEGDLLPALKFLAETREPAIAERLRGILQVARSCGWWWPRERLAVLCERPVRISRDFEGRLHAANGPAVEYPDGWSLFAWHGTPVPGHVVLRPDALTVAEIRDQPNTEVRRVMIDRYGPVRYLADAGARPVHADACGTLYKLNDRKAGTIAVVKVVNLTPEPDGSRREYQLRVPPHMRRASQAVAWTFGMGEREYAPGLQT